MYGAIIVVYIILKHNEQERTIKVRIIVWLLHYFVVFYYYIIILPVRPFFNRQKWKKKTRGNDYNISYQNIVT